MMPRTANKQSNVCEPCDRPVSLNVNFDSLSEAFGYPRGFRDPSYFSVFDRISNIVSARDVRLSLYMIGRDLENPEVAARVREWAEAGHEIGNHSWSHHMNLGTLPQEGVDAEIGRSHEAIEKVAQQAPVGFVAPAWSASPRVLRSLMKLGYQYDTSIFPSVFLYPMIGKVAFNHMPNWELVKRALSRGDWFYPLTRPITPFFADANYRPTPHPSKGILVLPLPTVGRAALPCWHTVGFVVGWSKLRKSLATLLRRNDAFYYLMHPADFAGPEDLDSNRWHALERLNVSVEEKMRRFTEILDIISESGRLIVPMRHLAADIAARLKSRF